MRLGGALLVVVAACSLELPDESSVEEALHEPVLVRYRLVGHPTQLPGFAVAYVDGSGAWQHAPPPVDGDTYVFPIRSRRFGVAFTCRPEFVGVFLRFFAVSETTDVVDHLDRACQDPFPTATATATAPLRGTITGISRPSGVTLAWGDGGVAGSYQFSSQINYGGDVVPGTHDLIALQYELPGSDQVTAQLRIFRDFTIPPEGRTFDFDFSQAPPPRAIPLIGDVPNVIVSLRTANGTRAFIGPVGALQFALFPSKDQVSPTDTTIISVDGITTVVNEPPIDEFVSPPPLGPVTAVASSTGFVATSWGAAPGATGYRWFGNQNGIRWEANISPGWFPGETKFVVPDLAGLGWSPSLIMKPGIRTTGNLVALGGNRGVGELWPAGLGFDLPLGFYQTRSAASWSFSP